MVVRRITTGGEYFFNGTAADTITVAEGYGSYIWTFEGNDVIDFRTFNDTGGGANAAYTGAGNDTIYGNSSTQYIYDGSGNDYLDLGADGDTVGAGYGDDTYIGGSGSDLIMFYWTNYDGYEEAGAYSTNSQAITLDLAITSRQNLGRYGSDLVLGFENTKGGHGDDHFYGTSGENGLDGQQGDDWLYGRDGSDTLVGRSGKDRMYAGNNDEDRDVIRYSEMDDSSVGYTQRDVVYEFKAGSSATADVIDLSDLDANASSGGDQAFTWRGENSFVSSNGEVRIYESSGGHTYVFIDTDEDSQAELGILVYGVQGLTSDNFIL
jgi:serralysin